MKHDTRPYVDRAKEVHGDAYDYTDTVYTTMHDRITVRCNTHGTVSTPTASDHIRKGAGCKQCRYTKAINSRAGSNKRWDTNEFISRAREVHGDKYSYDATEYTNAHTKVIVTCPVHGDWETRPSDHIRGNGGFGLGCPLCTSKMSAPERLIASTLTELGIMYKTQHPTEIRSDKGSLLFYDFYIPATNLCIEYDGRQHITNDTIYQDHERRQYLDNLKDTDASNRNYTLIRIPYHYTGKRLAAYISKLVS